ncbi:MAG: VWA domain-containing protein, partial [Abditibacteriales bacterium]|nr:VWA domain-containing protein [Abditibacteriales bacterium]MDW8367169.1 VWA domain-containing protein [Abditibacteriales bacterium]
MNFISPFHLLYFLPLAALIILLYLLKLKRKELVVSSTLLWQQVLRDLQANAPIQKLRKNLLLLLQLLILLFIVVGVARPYMSVRALTGENVAVILDASASMKATDVAPSRFEAARKEALRMVETLGAGDKMMVIEASSKTRVLTPFTSDKRTLKDVLARAQAKDTTCHLREAVVLALSLIKGQRNASVYILSDGAVEPIRDLRIGGATIKFVKFGRRADNLAITALDVRRSFAAASEYQIFVTVHNFSDREREINLELLHNNQLAKVRPMKIPAQRSTSEVFDTLG